MEGLGKLVRALLTPGPAIPLLDQTCDRTNVALNNPGCKWVNLPHTSVQTRKFLMTLMHVPDVGAKHLDSELENYFKQRDATKKQSDKPATAQAPAAGEGGGEAGGPAPMQS
eukprot:769295-Pelagomonas_calceolata.AAC.1